MWLVIMCYLRLSLAALQDVIWSQPILKGSLHQHASHLKEHHGKAPVCQACWSFNSDSV